MVDARVDLPDIEAQQQSDEDAWNDDVAQSQHGKVIGFKTFFQQVLRENHWKTEQTTLLNTLQKSKLISQAALDD